MRMMIFFFVGVESLLQRMSHVMLKMKTRWICENLVRLLMPFERVTNLSQLNCLFSQEGGKKKNSYDAVDSRQKNLVVSIIENQKKKESKNVVSSSSLMND